MNLFVGGKTMVSVGFRAAPKYVYFTIIDSDDKTFQIITCSKVIVPKALNIPEQLSFVRNCLFSIIQEYKAINAGIKVIESIANPNAERIYIEGVIQELTSNCCIEKYFTGTKSTLARMLGEKVTAISSYIDGKSSFAKIDNWDKFSKEERESIITAVAASSL